jgi:hypothetical protein
MRVHRQIEKDEMEPGTCLLCLKEADLLDSHFIPKGVYRRMRNEGDPIVMSPNLILGTSQQVRDYAFCADCERKLNSGGENYVLSLVFQGEGKPFPLLEALKLAKPIPGAGVQTFSGAEAGIDTEKFAYFAIGMLWKAGVKEWRTIAGQTTSVEVPTHMETMRRYLLGQASFPDDITVVLTACLDTASQYQTFSPRSNSDGLGNKFQLSVLGIYFWIQLGVPPGSKMRSICCVHSREKRIHVESCNQYSLEAFSSIQAKAKIAKNVEGTAYAKRR